MDRGGPRTQRIRALNDQLRQNLATGVAVMTPGVAALGEEATARIIKTIAVFDDFCHANDPHEEHDFGSFEAEGHTIFFKIDYLDPQLELPVPRSDRPSRHRPRDHGHARRRVLTAFAASSRRPTPQVTPSVCRTFVRRTRGAPAALHRPAGHSIWIRERSVFATSTTGSEKA